MHCQWVHKCKAGVEPGYHNTIAAISGFTLSMPYRHPVIAKHIHIHSGNNTIVVWVAASVMGRRADGKKAMTEKFAVRCCQTT